MKITGYKLTVILLILCILSSGQPLLMTVGAQEDYSQSYEKAYEKTFGEFAAIKNSSKEAVEKLDQILIGLRQAESNLQSVNVSQYLSNEKKMTLLENIKKSRLQVASSKQILENFNNKADIVSDALEAYDSVKEFKNQFNSYKANEGELAANLFALSSAMEKFGDNIPILGMAIKEYGALTTKLLSSISNLSVQIDEIRNQGAISGPGYYKTGANLEKYNILKSKNATLAESSIYRPAIPSFVYTSDDSTTPKLIWDEQTKDFYFISSTVPVENIFKMNLIALQQRRTPFELKVLSEKWETFYKPLSKTATKLPALMNNYKSGQAMESFIAIDSKYHNVFLGGMSNPQAFEANYVYNIRYRERFNNALNDLYNSLKAKNLISAANQIKTFATQNNIKIVEGPEPQKPSVTKKPVSQPDTQPSSNVDVIPQNQSLITPASNYSFYTGSIEALVPRSFPPPTEKRIQNQNYGDIVLLKYFNSPSIGPVSTVDVSMKITKHTNNLNTRPFEEVKKENNYHAFSSAIRGYEQITKYKSNFTNLQVLENNVDPAETEGNIWPECIDKLSQKTYHVVYFSQNPYPEKTIKYLHAHAGNIEVEGSISYFENRNSGIDLKRLLNEILSVLEQTR